MRWTRWSGNGPLRPLGKVTGAAAQLHKTGHSCIVQHFRRVKVGRAGLSCLSSRMLSCRRGREGPRLGLMRFVGEFEAEWTLLMAGSVASTLPLILISHLQQLNA